MTPAKKTKPAGNEAGVVSYSLVALLALLTIGLILAGKGMQTPAAIPLVIGLGGVVLRWRVAPLLLLAALLFIHMELRWIGWRPPRQAVQVGMADLVACAAVLAYVAALYRLQGLHSSLAPAEGKPVGKARARDRAPARTVPEISEVVQFLLTLPIWVSVAVGIWLLLPAERVYRTLPGHVWRLSVLAWALVVGGLIVAGLLAYRGWRRMPLAEARLFLQEIAWQETRREQGQINRWLAQTLRKGLPGPYPKEPS